MLIENFPKLKTPAKIQDYLETLPFNFERRGDTCMSPRRVLENRTAHCFEGALFAAYALYLIGHKPLLIDLKSDKNDFDHIIAPFKVDGYWGAISKTNHAVLRYREPIYKNIRELCMSYFHEYFLDTGVKTLISYSELFNLLSLKNFDWVTSEEDLWDICGGLDDVKHIPFLPKNFKRKNLRKADPVEIKAGKITN